MTPARPALRWHGGKWRMAPWVISHFPSHRVYVEPFGGAASVMLRKPAIPAEVYNDLDMTVVTLFRVLRDPVKALELQRRLRLTPFARAEFDWSYEAAVDDIDRAHKTIIRSFMGFGSDSVTRSCRTGFRTKLSDERALPSQSWSSFWEAVPSFTDRFSGVTIENKPALEIIDRYDMPQTLFYLDPPYLHGTRSSLVGRSKRTHGYTHEMSDDDHGQLLDRINAMSGMCIISGYPSPVYDASLSEWRRVERKAMADGARARTEVLWLNPAATEQLASEQRAAERRSRTYRQQSLFQEAAN